MGMQEHEREDSLRLSVDSWRGVCVCVRNTQKSLISDQGIHPIPKVVMIREGRDAFSLG